MKLILLRKVLVTVLLIAPLALIGQKKFKSKEYACQVKFPEHYMREAPQPEDDARLIVGAQGGEMSYQLKIIEHDSRVEGTPGLADESINAFAQSVDGNKLDSKNWKVKKRYGMQSTLSIPDHKVRYFVIYQDNIEYQLMVKGREGYFEVKDEEKFLKSFKLGKLKRPKEKKKKKRKKDK